MRAKRGDTTGVLGEFLMDQALANRMLEKALAGASGHRYSTDRDEDDCWAPVQHAIELGADWRKNRQRIQEAALRVAELNELRSLERAGLRFEDANPHLLGGAAARLGHAPWLVLALEKLAETGETLAEDSSRDGLMSAARNGQADMLAAFERNQPLPDDSLRQLATQCARHGRWKMCAKILREAQKPVDETKVAEKGAEMYRDALATWPKVWAHCVSMAAGRASEKGVKALLRAWRENANGQWDPGSAADAQKWLAGTQDSLFSALRARNKRSGERVAQMLSNAGLLWEKSEALPRALADGDLRLAEAAVKMGARIEGKEGLCGLAAARSERLDALRWAADRGVDFGAPSEEAWDEGESGLSYLTRRKNSEFNYDSEHVEELLGFAQAIHDASAMRKTIQENAAAAEGSSVGFSAPPASGPPRRKRL